MVCLEESIYIHNIKDMKLLKTLLNTPSNPSGKRQEQAGIKAAINSIFVNWPNSIFFWSHISVLVAILATQDILHKPGNSESPSY